MPGEAGDGVDGADAANGSVQVGEAAQPETPSSSAQRAPADDVNRVHLDTFTIVVPPGWDRVRQSEGKDGVALYLHGPDFGQERLRLAVSVSPLAARQTLEQLVTAYTNDLGAEKLLVNERVNLGARPARLLKFTNSDGLNHVLLAVYKQQAHVVVMVSPGGEGDDDLSTFNRVMQTFQYRE